MAEKTRVVLYVNDVQEGDLMESLEEAKQKAEPHIQKEKKVHIVVARWLKPLETLTYTYELADWSSKVG
jgi:anti-sigma-K factor RskA